MRVKITTFGRLQTIYYQFSRLYSTGYPRESGTFKQLPSEFF